MAGQGILRAFARYANIFSVILFLGYDRSCLAGFQFRSPLPEHNIISQASLMGPTYRDNGEGCLDHPDCTVLFRPFALAYHRKAAEAYRSHKKDDCCNQFCPPGSSSSTSSCNNPRVPPSQNERCSPCLPCGGLERQTLSNLWFGRASFRLEEALSESFLDPAELGTSYQPFVGFALIEPRFIYKEKGLVLGGNCSLRFHDNLFCVGMRVRTPYKVIRVNVEQVDEEELQSAYELPPSALPGSPPSAIQLADTDFAYRLDMLRSIIIYGTESSSTQLIRPNNVNINPPTGLTVDISGDDPETVPLYVIRSDCAKVPLAEQLPGAEEGVVRVGKVPSQVSGPLPQNGCAEDGKVYFLADDVDYAATLGKNSDLQRTFFFVPRFDTVAPTTTYSLDTNVAKEALLAAHFAIAGKVGASNWLLDQCGIDLNRDDSMAGIGDLQTDFYVGYDGACYALYGILGVVFPSGKKHEDTRRVYQMTTGNNGHFEIRASVEGSYALEYSNFALRFDGELLAGHAFKASERRATPFTGARVRNIGECIKTNVSWSYGIARFNMIAMLLSCFGIESLFGYELFIKGGDQVSLCEAEAKDCFGRLKGLDHHILERDTSVLTHKARGEITVACGSGSFCLGGSYIFAGRSAMAEVDLHVGVTVIF